MISVIIPVKNGALTLNRCLSGLRSQSIAVLEIIILDSASTDNSRQIAADFGAKVVTVEKGTFNHGLTRNLAVQYASFPILYYTVQDAWLSDNDVLEKMLEHFNDPTVMGVVGHQAIPHDRSHNPLFWFKRYSEPISKKRFVESSEIFSSLPVQEQQKLVAWDNVIAMYRKSALEQLPFVKTEFAEDWIWSEQAIKRGWTTVHDPALVTWHYHHRGFVYSFNVTYALNFHFYKFLGYTPKVSAVLKSSILAGYHLLNNGKLSLREKLFWYFHNVASIFGTCLSEIDFLFRLKIGGWKSLENGYRRYCKTVPQGKLKNQYGRN